MPGRGSLNMATSKRAPAARRSKAKAAAAAADKAMYIRRTVTETPDPDYPGFARIRETFEPSDVPAEAHDVAAFQRSFGELTIPRRLAKAEQRLNEILGTPEHVDGVELLRHALKAWERVNDPSTPPPALNAIGDKLLADLAHLVDVTYAGLRRLDLRPILERDAKRQAGTRKPRRPAIDEWIAKALTRHPEGTTRPELWEKAPQWIKDQIGKDAFLRRVSKIRVSRK